MYKSTKIKKKSDGMIIKVPDECARIRINSWRVKEGYPVSSGQVVLLYEPLPIEGKKDTALKTIMHKLKTSNSGVVKKRHFQNGAIVDKGTPILELCECVHTTVIKDMCADCGSDLRQNTDGNPSEASVPMVHSIPDLKVTQQLAQKLGHDDTVRLLKDRKLVLLVDLDQTVIHTTNDNVPVNIKDIYHFQLYGPQSTWYHTRLRPHTLSFLEHISKFYELHICTFGARNYAHMIAQILDPNGRLFSQRILSRDECFNATSKTDNLRALFPNGDSMVCIIDDREDVWKMASNLIQVKPYHFFQYTGDINAPPGLAKNELDGEGVTFNDNKRNVNVSESDSAKDHADKDATLPNSIANENVNNADDSNSLRDKENHKSEANNSSTDTSQTQANTKDKTDTKNEDNAEHRQNDMQTNTNEAENVCEAGKSDCPTVQMSKNNNTNNIDIEDTDDYLIYLENILERIHKRFYAIYDETNEIPDLKIVIPKIRSEVLRDCNLVFSGLVPTNMKLEQSKAFFIAKSLGAGVAQNIVEDTTHLVAATAGTFKVNAARKISKIKIVNTNWLWSCAERWEQVEEKLFPLDRKVCGKQRQPPAHCQSAEQVIYNDNCEMYPASSANNAAMPSENFIDTINPLLSFSNDDLAAMNKEFDQFFDSDSSTGDEFVNIENPPIDKNLRKRKRELLEEDRTRKFFNSPNKKNTLVRSDNSNSFMMKCDDEKTSSDDDDDSYTENNDEDDEMPSEKFRRGGDLPSDLDMDSDDNTGDNNFNEDNDSNWNTMGAALEREFLRLEN